MVEMRSSQLSQLSTEDRLHLILIDTQIVKHVLVAWLGNIKGIGWLPWGESKKLESST